MDHPTMKRSLLPPHALPSLFPAPLKVIAFDCDGVLFDSKEANVLFYSRVLEHLGHAPVRPDQEEFIHMHPVKESLRYLLPADRDFDEAYAYCQGMDFGDLHARLHQEPGLIELLDLAKLNYRVAVATNRTISAREVLEYFHIDHYFDLVVSALDVAYPKPHPASMERILDTFAAEPHQVLYVGDSRVDEELAEATGVYFVAYKNAQLKAHVHIQHFDQLHALLAAHLDCFRVS